MSRILTTRVASVYPHYVTKVERKGRTKAELHQVVEWLTGSDEAALEEQLASGTIRYLDKLVDELAKGKSMDKVLRA